jgi:D-lactate dehydrogenase
MNLNGLVAEVLSAEAFSGSFDSSGLRRTVWSRDASHYAIVPVGTAKAMSTGDVAEILAAANTHRVPVTFRSGGSSLSGQTLGTGVVVDVRTGFQKILSIDSDRVRIQPGVTISRLNGHLLRRGRKIGPDPASMVVSTIGGAVSNNSSGMSCGTKANSYATIASATIVLADGTIIDTSSPIASGELAIRRPDIASGLTEIRDALRADKVLSAEIRRLFTLKNTMGYSLQAFLDYDTPVEILLHLMVGSQGTLGFLGEIELLTLPVLPQLASTVVVFDSLQSASKAIADVLSHSPAAIELLDSNSLTALSREGLLPEALGGVVDGSSVVFLVDFEAQTPEELSQVSEAFRARFDGSVVVHHATGEERFALWKARKTVYAVVAKNRPAGTTALLEDVVVPPKHLAVVCDQLAALCEEFGYHQPVFFGHVRDGNVHFMICDDFSTPSQHDKLGAFTDKMVEIILGLGGNLKAEHGSGRAMAPFVERQFGTALYGVMQQIKVLLDPQGILNPGVIFPTHPKSHLDNLKAFPAAHEIVDSCVECGFCESQCPSAGLTLTPRERIVALRERGGSAFDGDSALSTQERYEIDQTCAVDGMCAINCPVGINTGSLVKELRAKSHAPASEKGGGFAERHWRAVLALGRSGLKIASLVPRLAGGVSRGIRALAPKGSFPLYHRDIPASGYSRAWLERAGGPMVFLPSCMNSLFGDRDLEVFLELAARHGYPLQVPRDVESFCCGTPFSSKGYAKAASEREHRTTELLAGIAAGAVIIDGSSCHQTLLSQNPTPTLEITQFIATYLGDVPVKRRQDRIVLHPTCSGEKTGSNVYLAEIAGRIADEVIVPTDWKCCGFAGDRGLLVPELTAHATALESAELRGIDAVRVSNNQPCQIALSHATGVNYRSIVSAWLEAVR